MFLAGDVGGTKVNLALCEVSDDGTVKAHSLRRFASAQFKSLSSVLAAYLSEVKPGKEVQGACFGVPGPVVDGKCTTVNLPWQLDAREVESETNKAHRIGHVTLVNDLEATAHGLKTLREGRGLTTLRVGQSPFGAEANQVLIAPGTGLGEALLLWDGERHVVSPSEGGHADFGPQDEEQIELLRWLWPRHKHVSWEHVASGPAIHRLYRFLIETGREKEQPAVAEALARPGIDPSPVIAALAIEGKEPSCVRAFDLWLFCLGAEAGNLALKNLSYGGIFIGGGIIPNILELFRRPSFFNGLDSKGRMSAIVKAMPVYGVVDPLAACYGAALVAYGTVKA